MAFGILYLPKHPNSGIRFSQKFSPIPVDNSVDNQILTTLYTIYIKGLAGIV